MTKIKMKIINKRGVLISVTARLEFFVVLWCFAAFIY